MPDIDRLNMNFDADLKKALKAYAFVHNKPLQEVVEDAVKKYLDTRGGQKYEEMALAAIGLTDRARCVRKRG